MLGINFEPAPLLGTSRALEVVGLWFAEGEEAADFLTCVVMEPDSQRAVSGDLRAIGQSSTWGKYIGDVAPPTQRTLGVRDFELVRPGRQHGIQLKHQPRIVLHLGEAARCQPLAVGASTV